MDDIDISKQIVLGVIKSAKGKVLIVNRVHPEKAKDNQVLSWVFPGGNVHIGETEEQALAREIREETGYEVQVGEKISERSYPKPLVYLKYFECQPVKVKTSVIEETHEVDRIKWVEPNLLPKFFTTDIDPGVARYLGIV